MTCKRNAGMNYNDPAHFCTILLARLKFGAALQKIWASTRARASAPKPARRAIICASRSGKLEACSILLRGDAGDLAEHLHKVALARKTERR
jgi:hypothetical protein